MTDQQAPTVDPNLQVIAQRRSTRAEIATSIDLGWRVAALHALSPTTMRAPSNLAQDMLLNRRSLSASDRVELEMRAIAGVAARVGVPLAETELQRLLDLASRAGESAEGEQAFRDQLSSQHIEFEKRLWAADEPSGRAYELGNFLSDTWNRVLRPRVNPDAYSELEEIFSPARVQRMKRLLDDLQARIDPVAAHTVESHLDDWRDRVSAAKLDAAVASAAKLTPEQIADKLDPVQRQTIIWRQMLTGDKEPEAWIGRAERAEVRDEFTHQIWRRYRRLLTWVLPLVAVLGAAIAILYAHNSDYVRGLVGTAFALAGTVGLTRASMASALKSGLQDWGNLMYNRALAAVICRETLVLHELDDLLRPPPSHGRKRLTRAA